MKVRLVVLTRVAQNFSVERNAGSRKTNIEYSTGRWSSLVSDEFTLLSQFGQVERGGCPVASSLRRILASS